MIYEEKPKKFDSKFEVVSCFVEYEGEILLLHRQDHKSEGNTWWVPAGKVDEWENILEAIVRELHEETWLVFNSSQLSYFGKVFVKYPDYDFIYNIFYKKLNKEEKVFINDKEHKDFKWISPKNAMNMPLIKDLDSCIKLFYKI